MTLATLFQRNTRNLPGRSGVLRIGQHPEKVIRRLKAGDIAAFPAPDLDQATAEQLVAARPAIFINTAQSQTGRFPNRGPEVLLEAGITIIDNVGEELFRRARDGATVRIHDSKVFSGDRRIARGVTLTQELVAAQAGAASQSIDDYLAQFAQDTAGFLGEEAGLIVDGVGIPDTAVAFASVPVLVVGGVEGAEKQLKRLRPFIGEYHPILIGVGGGADVLLRSGYRPHVALGTVDSLSDEALTRSAEVVLSAPVTGEVPGLERVFELGATAVTFPAAVAPEDQALLLAEHHGAELIVGIVEPSTLEDFFNPSKRAENPSRFLTKLKLGEKFIDSHAVASLYRSRVSVGTIVFFLLVLLAAIIAVLMILGPDLPVVSTLVEWWNSFVLWLRGLFS